MKIWTVNEGNESHQLSITTSNPRVEKKQHKVTMIMKSDAIMNPSFIDKFHSDKKRTKYSHQHQNHHWQKSQHYQEHQMLRRTTMMIHLQNTSVIRKKKKNEKRIIKRRVRYHIKYETTTVTKSIEYRWHTWQWWARGHFRFLPKRKRKREKREKRVNEKMKEQLRNNEQEGDNLENFSTTTYKLYRNDWTPVHVVEWVHYEVFQVVLLSIELEEGIQAKL